MKQEVQPPKSSRSIAHATAHKPLKSSLLQIKAQMPVPGASQGCSSSPRPSFQAFPHSPLLPPPLLPFSKHPTSSPGGSTQSAPAPAAHLRSRPRPAAGLPPQPSRTAAALMGAAFPRSQPERARIEFLLSETTHRALRSHRLGSRWDERLRAG